MVKHLNNTTSGLPNELLDMLTKMVIEEAKRKAAYFGGYGNAIYALTEGMEMAAEVIVRSKVSGARQIEDIIYEVMHRVKAEA